MLIWKRIKFEMYMKNNTGNNYHWQTSTHYLATLLKQTNYTDQISTPSNNMRLWVNRMNLTHKLHYTLSELMHTMKL